MWNNHHLGDTDPMAGDPPSGQLMLREYDCDEVADPTCASWPSTFGPEALGAPMQMFALQQPSVAIRSGPGRRVIHVVHRELLDADCDGDGIAAWQEDLTVIDPATLVETPNRAHESADLGEVVWNTTSAPGAAETEYGIRRGTHGACDGRPGVTYTRVVGSLVRTSFTWDYLTDIIPDQEVRTADRMLTSVWGPSTVPFPNPVNQDHNAMIAHATPTQRVIAFREQAADDGEPSTPEHQVRVVMPDLGVVWAPFPPTSPNRIPDYPTVDLSVDAGRLAFAWEDHVPTPAPADIAHLRTTECSPLENCKLEVYDPVTTDFSEKGIAHVELESMGERQFMIFQANVGTNNTSRVLITGRCQPSEPWVAPVVLFVPPFNPEARWQSLAFGRPHLVVDEPNELVHVVFVEMDAPKELAASSSRLRWLRGPVTAISPLLGGC